MSEQKNIVIPNTQAVNFEKFTPPQKIKLNSEAYPESVHNRDEESDALPPELAVARGQ